MQGVDEVMKWPSKGEYLRLYCVVMEALANAPKRADITEIERATRPASEMLEN